MKVNKAEIIAILRTRGLPARADWVARALPDVFETDQNRSLLSTLGIDPADLSPADKTPQHA